MPRIVTFVLLLLVSTPALRAVAQEASDVSVHVFHGIEITLPSYLEVELDEYEAIATQEFSAYHDGYQFGVYLLGDPEKTSALDLLDDVLGVGYSDYYTENGEEVAMEGLSGQRLYIEGELDMGGFFWDYTGEAWVFTDAEGRSYLLTALLGTILHDENKPEFDRVLASVRAVK